MSLLGALQDKQFWRDIGSNANDLGQAASNSVASNVTAPVDGLAWLLRKAGVNMPTPVGGSDWAKNAGLLREVPDSPASVAGDTLGMIAPMLMMAKAPEIARGLLQTGENLAAPRTLNPQSGMIRIEGRGQIPETRGDVNKLADRFAGLLDDAKVNYSHDKSGLSPARYFEFDNPKTLGSEYGPDRFKVRISDHSNVHGADISVDPATGGTFEEMLQSVRDLGVPVLNKVRPASKTVIDDATLEKIWGKPVSQMKNLDDLRNRYVLSKKGFWTEKR